MGNGTNSLNGYWWFPLYEFFLHVTVGTGIFIVIALPAIGLSLLVEYWTGVGIDQLILYGLTGVKYLLFAVDLILFVIFITRSAVTTGRELWKI